MSFIASNPLEEQESIVATAPPVAVHEGDRVDVRLDAHLVGDGYVWRWDTDIRGGAAEREVKACFRQSTFYGVPPTRTLLNPAGQP